MRQSPHVNSHWPLWKTQAYAPFLRRVNLLAPCGEDRLRRSADRSPWGGFQHHHVGTRLPQVLLHIGEFLLAPMNPR